MILGVCSGLLAVLLALAAFFRTHWSVPRTCFVAGMGLLAADSMLGALAADALRPDQAVGWVRWKLVTLSLLPAVWLPFSLSYARGSDRQWFARWRIWPALVCLAPIAVSLLFFGRLLGPILQKETFGQWAVSLNAPGLALSLLVLVSAILILMNLEFTFRAAVGTMRWRIKFMILGVGLVFVVHAYTCSETLLFRAVDLSLQGVNSGALLLGCLLVGRSLMRMGHFEVDVYPSQAVLHSSLTVLLAGAYLMAVGVFAKGVAVLGGDFTLQIRVFLGLVSLVVLAILLLSDRVRLHIRRFISRHFQRPQFDYRTLWKTFTEGTVRRLEQTDLCNAIVKLISATFQTLSVTIWLVDELKERLLFGASTSLSPESAGRFVDDTAAAASAIKALSEGHRPVDLDGARESWAAVIRRLHPEEFRKGGNRLAVPLMAGEELLGVMLLGDRVGGVSFSMQDLDVLTSIGEQAAASLLNIRLSQSLAHAKQLEAFQAMSAFFVHDLKNATSTLSLMLKNLPVHFADPNFREDALRGIGRTVTYLNDLIDRLGLIRRELTIQPVACDLNAVVLEALTCLDGGPEIELVKELRPLPRVMVDPAQMRTVVTNLALNARDASGLGGRITVSTSRQNNHVVLSFADNGCGMSPEFVRDSLFRPFTTTKKNGIGIGMFQCRIMVEANRGRIEVASQPGKGTTFRVLIPAHGNSELKPPTTRPPAKTS